MCGFWKGISGVKIVFLLLLVVIIIFSYNFFNIYSYYAPEKTFEILEGSQTKNEVTILNLGDSELIFSQLTVTVNNKNAFIINPHTAVGPGDIGILRFNTPVFGGNLHVTIKGPDNEETYVVTIIEQNTFPVCLDGMCEAGENCPSDAISCEDKPCYQPTCVDGCADVPIADGETDEGCSGDNGCEGGNCACDGYGNCVSGG